MTSTQSSKYGLQYRNLKNTVPEVAYRLPFSFNREVASSFRLVMILGLSAFVSSNALSQESASPPVEKSAQQSNSVDRKPTEERLVNPVALSEKTPLGWQTGFIGAFRGTFDLSIGVKFSPEHTQFRNLIFGGTWT